MTFRPSNQRKSASVLLVMLVLVFVLLLLGYTLWQIWKIIRSMPATPKNQVEQTAGDMINEFQSVHSNEPISLVLTQAVTVTAVQPFDTINTAMRIWRSTNLIDWEVIATNLSGQTWTDTNAPWPNGFYKQEIIR